MAKLSRILRVAAGALALCNQGTISVSGKENLIEPSLTQISYPLRIEALCSLYSQYETCHPVVTINSISANFPTEYLVLNSVDIVAIDYLERKGDHDFAIKYREDGKTRTAFIRFKNSNSIFRFSEAIKPLQNTINVR